MPLIAWIGASEITFWVLFRAFDFAGEKAAAQGTKGHEANTQLAQNRNYLGLQIPFPKRVLALQRRDRMDGVSAANIANAGLGKTEKSHLPLFRHPG